MRFVTAIIVPSRRQSILIGYERARVVGGGEGIDNLYFNDCTATEIHRRMILGWMGRAEIDSF